MTESRDGLSARGRAMIEEMLDDPKAVEQLTGEELMIAVGLIRDDAPAITAEQREAGLERVLANIRKLRES